MSHNRIIHAPHVEHSQVVIEPQTGNMTYLIRSISEAHQTYHRLKNDGLEVEAPWYITLNPADGDDRR